jgi:hypothetical protein
MMYLFDKILRFFGFRRIDLDKPMTLLGHYYYDVQDKVYHSAYSIYDDVDWGLYYYRNDEEDPGVQVCQWESIKIISTVIHDDNDMVLRAGKIYIDKDKNFVDEVIAGVTSGKNKMRRKVRYPHYEADELDVYYHYNDDVCLRVRKEYDKYERNWKAEVEYILCKPAKAKFPVPQRRAVSDDRNRIMDDITKNLN